MSEKIARKHQNQTNRARPRNGIDKKVVYKSVLENPFCVEWPSMSPNVQNMLLAHVVQHLDGVSAYHSAKHTMNRQSRKRRSEGISSRKRRGETSQSDERTTPDSSGECTKENYDNAKSPEIVHHMTIGINEVTKDLELQARTARQTLTSGAETSDNATSHCSKLVLVCRGDINPPILIAHLPQLVASCNLTSSSHGPSLRAPKVWLAPLAKGAEESLAQALGLRRVSVLTIKSTAPNFPELLSLLASIPILTPPWAQPSTPGTSLHILPTHIKQLRTTAPKNIKEARQKKVQAKILARSRKKASRSTMTKIPHRAVIPPKP
ncbi:hypothetical protein QCA50_002153 [Cerrena zonata]|uniref:Uncharacterized protein n=1 Tax=Cerrena zonata TaxID=2478898 RepID=A0AAW0GP40_9APHY